MGTHYSKSWLSWRRGEIAALTQGRDIPRGDAITSRAITSREAGRERPFQLNQGWDFYSMENFSEGMKKENILKLEMDWVFWVSNELVEFLANSGCVSGSGTVNNLLTAC